MPTDHMTSPPMRFENGLETQPPLLVHALVLQIQTWSTATPRTRTWNWRTDRWFQQEGTRKSVAQNYEFHLQRKENRAFSMEFNHHTATCVSLKCLQYNKCVNCEGQTEDLNGAEATTADYLKECDSLLNPSFDFFNFIDTNHASKLSIDKQGFLHIFSIACFVQVREQKNKNCVYIGLSSISPLE